MFQLRITSGPHAGQIVQLVPGQACVIGRDPQAQVSVPDDKTLSRAHAEVAESGGGWVLRNKSQHGTMVAGELIQGEQPLQPGTALQAGAQHLVFEPAPAGAAPAAGAASPAPAPAAGGGSGGGKGGKAADKLGAAAAQVGAGAAPVKIENPGPGFPFMDLVKGGLTVVKANLFPSLILFLPYLVPFLLLQVGPLVLPRSLITIFALVGAVLLLAAAIAMPQVILNYMEGVKNFQETGERFGIGQLLRPTNLIQRYLTLLVLGLPGICCFLIPMFLFMAVPIIVDRPNVGFMNAVKGGLAYGKRNIVPLLLLFIVGGLVYAGGAIACGVGILVTFPLLQAYLWLAYELKREEIAEMAAADGVPLS